jgi:23S rRNA pseudouridine1911/1915/1917 synthase
VVFGPRIDDGGTFQTLYGRHPRDRKKMSSKVEAGKEAITHWNVVARSQSMALLRLRLETGRTHQIRVHLSDSGHPVVGDSLYGQGVPKAGGGPLAVELAAARRLTRQALHAQRLGFIHPTSGEEVAFGSRVPEDMAALIATCFGSEVLESLGS